MPDDHYVSRTFQKYWSLPTPNGGWSKRVWCFDFDRSWLRPVGTRQLFSRADLNTPATERWLSGAIEQPLTQLVDRDTATRDAGGMLPPVEVIEQPRIALALSLVHLVQLARGADAVRGKARQLESIMALSDSEQTELARAFADRHVITKFAMPPGAALFLPECGWFHVPVPDPVSAMSWTRAIPLTPGLALLAVPRYVQLAPAEWMVPLLPACSVGVGGALRRVVVPPVLLTRYGRPELIRRIKTQRTKVAELFENVQRARSARRALWALTKHPMPDSLAGPF
jgi:hypothetical protein